MKSLIEKWHSSFIAGEGGAFLVFIIYGTFLLLFLFLSVHDRTDLEFKKRQDSRWQKVIMNWINHGYIRHAGFEFYEPLEKMEGKSVRRSSSMAWLQIAHLLQRGQYYFSGKFSHRLMAYHNQLIPFLSASLLGFLAMRLTLNMNIPYFQALLLGLSAQTVHQTFPLNLGVVWGIYSQSFIVIFLLLFFIIEENLIRTGKGLKVGLLRGLVVFFMTLCEPSASIFFLLTYYTFRILILPIGLNLVVIFKSAILPFVGGLSIQSIQLLWVHYLIPKISFTGSSPLFRTGFDGDTEYYFNHWDLLGHKWLLNLPNSNPIYLIGLLALIIVVSLIQIKKRYFSQQIILLSGLGGFIVFAFLFSNNVMIHPYAFELYLAWPLILSLFALMPAWLEIVSRYHGGFVLISCVIALFTSGVQLLGYWLYMPPLSFL
jgi:hypothetical protein